MLGEAITSYDKQQYWICEIQQKLFLKHNLKKTYLSEKNLVPRLTQRRRLEDDHYNWLHARASFEDGILCSEWTGRPIKRMSVHHIDGVLWLRTLFDPLEKVGADLYNDPYNLIVLDEDEHRELHPDSLWIDYLRATKSPKLFEEIEKIKHAVINGAKNWIDTWDNDFKEIAYARTLQLIRSGRPWPLHDTQYENYRPMKLMRRLSHFPILHVTGSYMQSRVHCPDKTGKTV